MICASVCRLLLILLPLSFVQIVFRIGRSQGVSKHTIYAWKAKYGGMEVSEAEEVKHLRDENARLKKLVADQALDVAILRETAKGNF